MNKRIKWLLILAGIALSGLGFYEYWINRPCRCDPPPFNFRDTAACLYDTVYLPAKVIRTDTSSGDYVYIDVTVQTTPGIPDTMSLHREPPYQLLSKKDFLLSGIRKGDEFFCSLYNIKSGSCSPKVYWFKWERYHANSHPSPAGKVKKIVSAGPSY